MILKHLELTNFRCFESLLVPLDKHLNVFVGGNGTGKTAILDSLALALAPTLNRLPLEKKGRVPPLVSADIRLTAENRSAPFLHLAAAGEANGAGDILWDRTKFRDPSPTTKKEAPPKWKELKDLHRYLDGITDAHNASQPTVLSKRAGSLARILHAAALAPGRAGRNASAGD
jgi:predicted ATP-binding protein involved in virulence